MRRHNSGAGAEFTARRRPVELIWSARFLDSEAARRKEKEIKGWSKERKLSLIAAGQEARESQRMAQTGSRG
jgi:putative endonuclease